MKKNKILKVLITIFTIMLLFGGKRIEVSEIEDKEISAGIGISLIEEGKNRYLYNVSDNVYFFYEDSAPESGVYTGKASTIGKTRDDRATRLGKQFFLGQEKVFLMDEEFARNGVRVFIDILFNNPIINDNAYCAVTKGPSVDYFKHNIEGFSSPSEYIEGMLKHMEDFNFFKEQYKVKDIFVILDSEGRNIVLPYIEISKDGFNVSGVAVFNNDKIADILDINETKIMNLLRNNNVKGMLTIQDSNKQYINYYAKSKKKVKCTKKDGKYNFVIELALNGDIVSNSLYKDMDKETVVIEEFQKDMEKKIEAMCNDFINKMKHDIRVDCLELGRLAAAKYGRDTGVDWNSVICDSDIKVKVKVKVDRIGRGQY